MSVLYYIVAALTQFEYKYIIVIVTEAVNLTKHKSVNYLNYHKGVSLCGKRQTMQGTFTTYYSLNAGVHVNGCLLYTLGLSQEILSVYLDSILTTKTHVSKKNWDKHAAISPR